MKSFKLGYFITSQTLINSIFIPEIYTLFHNSTSISTCLLNLVLSKSLFKIGLFSLIFPFINFLRVYTNFPLSFIQIKLVLFTKHSIINRIVNPSLNIQFHRILDFHLNYFPYIHLLYLQSNF